MPHFLNRLAARALGAAPVAEPLVPAAFASGFELAATVRSDFKPETYRVSDAGERVRDAAPADFAHEAAAERVPALAPVRAAGVLPRASLTVPMPLAQPARAEEESLIARETLPTIEPAPVPSPARAADRFAAEQAAPVIERAESPFESHPRIRAEQRTTPPFFPARRIPIVRMAPSRREAGPSADAAAPVIRVNIGRIDVRAQFPPAASAPPAKRARPGALSLEEYAKQRSEGRR